MLHAEKCFDDPLGFILFVFQFEQINKQINKTLKENMGEGPEESSEVKRKGIRK